MPIAAHFHGRDYVSLLRKAIERGDPYQVEVLRKQGVYHVHITVEETPAALTTYPINGWVGMDTNPTLLALCHVRPDGNPAAFVPLVYRKVLAAVERRALREGVEIRKIHPAYTSVIGRLKYQPQYGMSVHAAAALVIARRGGLKIRRENVPKALRQWLLEKGQFNEQAYRKNDWRIWNQAKKAMEKTLQERGGSLVSWLDLRKGLLLG